MQQFEDLVQNTVYGPAVRQKILIVVVSQQGIEAELATFAASVPEEYKNSTFPLTYKELDIQDLPSKITVLGDKQMEQQYRFI
eukprot:5176053-Lingulodinium_polyedra.AAC.1